MYVHPITIEGARGGGWGGEREREGEGERERERERDCVSCHLWALVLGNTSCFDMSHNLWESVRRLARHTHTHTDRQTHAQSEQRSNRMWKDVKEGERTHVMKEKNSSASVLKTAPATVLISRWWEKWGYSSDTLTVTPPWSCSFLDGLQHPLLIFVGNSGKHVCVCVCVCRHFIYVRLVVEKYNYNYQQNVRK